MATTLGVSQVKLTWAAAADNVRARKYEVERQDPGSTRFVRVGTTTGTSYNDTGLAAVATTVIGSGEGCEGEAQRLFRYGQRDNRFTNNRSSQMTIPKRSCGERIQNNRYLLDGNNTPFLIIGDAPLLS